MRWQSGGRFGLSIDAARPIDGVPGRPNGSGRV
jgi:hypothetical protein